MLRINTEYYKINFQINEGGKYITFGFMWWQPDYSQVATTKGFIRLYLFGKVFTHWFKK